MEFQSDVNRSSKGTMQKESKSKGNAKGNDAWCMVSSAQQSCEFTEASVLFSRARTHNTKQPSHECAVMPALRRRRDDAAQASPSVIRRGAGGGPGSGALRTAHILREARYLCRTFPGRWREHASVARWHGRGEEKRKHAHWRIVSTYDGSRGTHVGAWMHRS